MFKNRFNDICNSNVVLLLASIFISSVGIGITQMYSLIYIYSKTSSIFCVALQSATIFGSGVISSYFYFRRKKRRNLIKCMLTSEFVCFLAVASIAYMQQLALMYIALMVVYISSGFFKPSYQAILYRLVNPKYIAKVNAYSSILYNVALAIGWVVAPLCFDVVHYRGLFLFDSISYLVSGFLILIVSKKMLRQRISFYDRSDKYLQQNDNLTIKTLLSANPQFLKILLLITSITIIKASIDALEMGIFKRVYDLSNILIGVFFTVWILGGVFAGVVNNMLSDHIHAKAKLLRINTLMLVLTTFAFVCFNSRYVGMSLYGICGFLYIFSQISSDNYIYQNTAKEMHAHNFSFKNIVVNITMLICIPLLGLVADKISIFAAVCISTLFAFLFIFLERICPVRLFSKA